MNVHSSSRRTVWLSSTAVESPLPYGCFDPAPANTMTARIAHIIDRSRTNLSQDGRLALVVLRLRSDCARVNRPNVGFIRGDLTAHPPAALRTATTPSCDLTDARPELDQRSCLAGESIVGVHSQKHRGTPTRFQFCIRSRLEPLCSRGRLAIGRGGV